MPGPSNRDATVLSPTAGNIYNGPCATTVVEIESDSGSDSPTQSACTVGSSFPVAEKKLKRQANHEQLVCAQSNKFILFLSNRQYRI